MKTFRYPLGHPQYVTLTVGELRAKLAEYPDDLPVLAEWESIFTPIRADCDSVQMIDHCHADDTGPALILYVDQ